MPGHFGLETADRPAWTARMVLAQFLDGAQVATGEWPEADLRTPRRRTIGAPLRPFSGRRRLSAREDYHSPLSCPLTSGQQFTGRDCQRREDRLAPRRARKPAETGADEGRVDI